MFQSSEVLPAASAAAAARAVSGHSSSFEEILKPFGAGLSQPTAHLAALLCFVRSETQPAAAFKGCWAGYQFKLLSCLNGITWRGPAAPFLGQFFIQKHEVTGCDGTFLLWLTCVSVYSLD